MGLKSTGGGGEIVQVQGGHILRATGRKDRHSKVFTAKGPRDRRVRLAAHTAIQFYDVQDRLGYDRPSKAVDWLINKAKASIDRLNELPPWDPTTVARHAIAFNNHNDVDVNNDDVGSSNKQISLACGGSDTTLGMSQFCVPQCVDSSTIKSFFPTHTCIENNDSLCFQNYPQELIPRGTGHDKELSLSLQTIHDPGVPPGHEHALFQGGFDDGWAQQHDMGRFMGGILFNNNPPIVLSPQALLLNQQGLAMTNYSHSDNQRSTLQSIYSPLPRVFEDNHNHQSISGIGNGSDSIMGFYIPSHIHGDLHGGASMSNKASSSSLSPDSSQH